MESIYENNKYTDKTRAYEKELTKAIAPLVERMLDEGVSHGDIFRLVNEWMVEVTCCYRLTKSIKAFRNTQNDNS